MRCFALALVLCAAAVQGADAQSGERWLVVPVAGTADGWVMPTSSFLHEELVARGVSAWEPADATLRFEAEGSAPPVELNESQKAAWKRAAKQVLESLVRGHPQFAIEILSREKLLALRTAVALNRDDDWAQMVFDTCLVGARAELETAGMADAEAMATHCRRLVIEGTPNPGMHPPPVTDALARADAARVDKSATLGVRSDPSDCAVRINGTLAGVTPLEVNELAPGRYMVQVECDPGTRGRIHNVDVGPGFTEVDVNLGLDGAVSTEPTLGLLDDPSIAAEKQESVLASIASILRAKTLVVIRAPAPETLELERMRLPGPSQAALVRIKTTSTGPTRGDVALATRALIDGRCMDLTTLPPTDLSCAAHPASATLDDWPPKRMPRAKHIAGLTLAGSGTAALLTGYLLIAPRARTATDWVENLDSGLGGATQQEKWVNMGVGQVVAASVGAGLLVTAMPLALPKRAKNPWWAWLSGGLGLGVAAAAIAVGVTAPEEPGTSCTSLVTDPTGARVCVERSERVNAAVLLGATAAPLLTIPLVYLLRPSRSKLEPQAHVSRAGGYLGLRGRF